MDLTFLHTYAFDPARKITTILEVGGGYGRLAEAAFDPEESSVKKRDNASFVLTRVRVDAAGVGSTGDLPECFGLAGMGVVARVEFAHVVLIMLGGNDVMASMPQQSAYYRVMVKLAKRLPRAPSVEWFRDVMTSILARLQSATSAKIGIISLPPWGENLDSGDAYQAELNRRLDEHNAVLRTLADEHRAMYIPFYERFCDLLRASPGRSFESFKILPFYRDIFRQLVLRKSNDEIGALNGWKFHRDGIHLNSTSGKLLADLVQGLLEQPLAGLGLG